MPKECNSRGIVTNRAIIRFVDDDDGDKDAVLSLPFFFSLSFIVAFVTYLLLVRTKLRIGFHSFNGKFFFLCVKRSREPLFLSDQRDFESLVVSFSCHKLESLSLDIS